MRSLTILAIAFTTFVALSASTALAYFEMNALIGEPTKTTLADGRIHYQYKEVTRQPFPADVKIPAPKLRDTSNDDTGAEDPDSTLQQTLAETDDDAHRQMLADIGPEHYYSIRGYAIMKPHWEVIKIEEHSLADQMICHDDGDKNTRLSLFKVSDKLKALLENKKESIVLTANANQHQCHGDPIFRRVLAAKFFGDEALLVTEKASYEDVFDEADVQMEVKHPHLTHFSHKYDTHEFDADAEDHGVYKGDAHNSATLRKNTFGAAAVPETYDRQHEVQIDNGGNDADEAAKQLAGKSESREARKQGWFKRLRKKIKKAVKRVAKRIRKVANRFVKNVSRFARKAVAAIKKFLTININKKLDKRFDFKKNYQKQVSILKIEANFHMFVFFKFQLYIKTNKLQIFHASVGGGLNLAAGARIPKTTRPASGQSTMFTINGFTLTFAIGPVPVWVSLDIPIIAQYEIGSSEYSMEAGARISASARYGVEYTRSRGFRTISERMFRRSHTLKYSLSFSASAGAGAQLRFKLYSFVNAYVQITAGIDGTLLGGSSAPAKCSLIKLTVDFYIAVTAGLQIKIKILKFSILDKSYGPWKIWSGNWRIINVCKQKPKWLAPGSKCYGNTCGRDEAALALPMSAEQERSAATLSGNSDSSTGTQAITSVDEDDSGMAWDVTVTCPDNSPDNGSSYDFNVIGFFQNDSAVFYTIVSRNVSDGEGGFDLLEQDMLFYSDKEVVLGLNTNVTVVPATPANAEELGIDYEDLQELSTKNKGSPNVTFVTVSQIGMTFSSTDIAQVTFDPSGLCKPAAGKIVAMTLKQNDTAPLPPPEGSQFGRMFAAFGKQLFPAFVRLITDVLVTVLVLAIAELVIAYIMPRYIIAPEHWPKQKQTPRTREYVYMAVSMSVGLLALIVFIVGINLNYVEIIGAQQMKNFTPAPSTETSIAINGVNTIRYQFSGATIKRRYCPQTAPLPGGVECSPGCVDQCVDGTYSWMTAPWPYCPSDPSSGDTIRTDNGGCTKLAMDAVVSAIFCALFLLVGPVVAVYKFDTVYRRMPILHACLMLSGMFLTLMWRRITSFAMEIDKELFDPADEMVMPYEPHFDSAAMSCFEGSVIIFFTMVGAVGLGGLYDMWRFYKDTLEGRIVKFDDDFEGGNDMDAAAAGGSPKGEYRDADSAAAQGDLGLGGSFAANVLNDLNSIPVDQEENNKADGELSLM